MLQRTSIFDIYYEILLLHNQTWGNCYRCEGIRGFYTHQHKPLKSETKVIFHIKCELCDVKMSTMTINVDQLYEN